MKMLRTNQPGGASRLKNCCIDIKTFFVLLHLYLCKKNLSPTSVNLILL